MSRTTILVLLLATSSAFAATSYLSVAFQNNSDNPALLPAGFVQFLGASSQTGITSEVFATVNGNVTVTVNAQVDGANLGGGYFDRGGLSNSGAFTYAALYNSFTYNNSSASFAPTATTSISLTLSGPGISASTAYSLTFFSFDTDQGRSTTGTHTATISGQSGTTGTNAVIVWTDAAPPATNNQYSNTQAFLSDGSGHLTFLVSDTYNFNTDSRSGVRLNAFILAPVPEPGSVVLVGGGVVLLGLLWRKRRATNPRD
jgi:hypothetical protein